MRAGLPWGQRTIHSNTHIGLLQGGRIIDAVSSHAHHVVAALQDCHNLVLVLGEHLCKTIGLLHCLAELCVALLLLVLQHNTTSVRQGAIVTRIAVAANLR